MFLHAVALNQHNGVTGANFIRSGETISRFFGEVPGAISSLENECIKGSRQC